MEIIETNTQILAELTDSEIKNMENESNNETGNHTNTINFLKLVSFKNDRLKKMLHIENDQEEENNKCAKLEDVIDDLQLEISNKLKEMNVKSDNKLQKLSLKENEYKNINDNKNNNKNNKNQ